MSRAETRSGFDTWVGSTKPGTPNYRDPHLRLDASGGAARALLYFASPAPRGATITSATLRVYTYAGNPASVTLTLHRLIENWKASTTTWDHAPDDDSVGAATATLTSAAPKGGVAIDFDVTAIYQAIANGAPNYGVQIETSSTALHYLYGIESGGTYKPTLTVEWEDAPATPTRLTPADGIVSESKPTLVCDYRDVSGNTTLKAIRVQIDPDADEADPAFDSGTEATVAPELDLSTTAFSGLVEDVPQLWRVQVQDGAGLWSDWSDWVAMTYTPKDAVTLTNPTGGLVTETTPPIAWAAFTGQTAYQVIVADADRPTVPLHDSGQRGGTATSYTLPPGVLTDDRTYTVEVRLWGGEATRVATPGAPIYSSASAEFSVDESDTVPAVSSLTATVAAGSPLVVLEWEHSSTMPDAWTIEEDGTTVLADLEPSALLVSGSTYRYTYAAASPHVEHVFGVRAVVNGERGPAVTASATTRPEGVWLVDPSDGLSVVLWGDDEGTWNGDDDAATYRPKGGAEVVRIVDGLRGLDGNLQGLLMEGFGKTFAEAQADAYALKSRPTARLRLIVSDVNMEALVGDLRIAPKPMTRGDRLVKGVSFNFWQIGDLPFDPHV